MTDAESLGLKAPTVDRAAEFGLEAPKPETPSWLSRAFAPVRNLPGAVGAEFQKGSEKVSEGERKLMEGEGLRAKAAGATEAALGGMQQFFSPLSGSATALVGDPVRSITGNSLPGRLAANTAEDVALLFGPGAVGKLAGASLEALPSFSGAVKTLMKEGVQLTPGQLSSGIVRAGEKALSKVPFGRDIVAKGTLESLGSFNRAVVNRALKPLGLEAESGASGRALIADAERKIGQKYEALLPKLTFQADPKFLEDAAGIEQNSLRMMPEQQQKQWKAALDNVLEHMDAQGTMTGPAFKEVDSDLAHLQRTYLHSDDPAHHQFSDAVGELRSAFRDALERANPKKADELRDLNTSWAIFKRAQDASVRRAANAGIFSPADLLQSTKKGSTVGAFARGDALLQDLAEAGNEVLPSGVPRTEGLAGRLGTELLLGGPGALLMGHPGIAAGVVGGSLPYTETGLRAINALARTAPRLARAIVEGLEKKPAAAAALLGTEPQGKR